MNYPDEDYVRYYTRETVSWRALGWEGQTVLALMLHGKFDRSGVFDCDGHQPSHAVTLVTGLPAEVVETGLRRLLDAKTWVLREGRLVWPKFIEAQTCRRTDRARQEESRRNRRDSSLGDNGDSGHTPSPAVTGGHTESQPVTPSRAEPNPAEQSLSGALAPEPVRSSKKQTRSAKTRLPSDFALTEKHLEHARSKGYPDWWSRNRFESFVEAARAKGFTNVDWDLALYGSWRREMTEWGNTPEKLAHLAPKGQPARAANPVVAAEAARARAEFDERRRQELAEEAARLTQGNGATGAPSPSEVRELTGSLFRG